MVMLLNRQLLTAKIEATRGTDSVPTSLANSILCGPVDTRLDLARINLNAVRQSISAVKIRLGRKMAEFTIKCDLKGSGTAGTAPEFSPLLRSCALAETITPATSVVYKPTSDTSAMKSCSIYFYYDGRLRKAVGCMGNFTLEMKAGEPAVITFTLRGKLTSEGDAAFPSDMVFQATEPVIVESAGVSYGAFNDAVIRSITLTSNNTVAERADVNSAEGIKDTFVSGRDPQHSATVEATTEAVKAWFGNLDARTEEAIDITIGTVAGNIVTIAIPKATLDTATDPQNDNGIITFPISGQAREDAGDDNYTISFT